MKRRNVLMGAAFATAILAKPMLFAQTKAADAAKMTVAAAINKAGRQRMLSQRTAKFFMFREWGLSKPVEADLNAARTEFRAAIVTLRTDPKSTDEIKTQLGLAETQWLFFDTGVEASLKAKADTIRRQNVANSSERILEVFETVTGMYERLAVPTRG